MKATCDECKMRFATYQHPTNDRKRLCINCMKDFMDVVRYTPKEQESYVSIEDGYQSIANVFDLPTRICSVAFSKDSFSERVSKVDELIKLWKY